MSPWASHTSSETTATLFVDAETMLSKKYPYWGLFRILNSSHLLINLKILHKGVLSSYCKTSPSHSIFYTCLMVTSDLSFVLCVCVYVCVYETPQHPLVSCLIVPTKSQEYLFNYKSFPFPDCLQKLMTFSSLLLSGLIMCCSSWRNSYLIMKVMQHLSFIPLISFGICAFL